MKQKIKKEIIFLAVCLIVGLAFGITFSLLQKADVVASPENERDLETWVFLAVIGGGIAICLGGTVLGELLKRNKKYEIEEKDERNQVIVGKAGFSAWGANIFALSAVITFCLVSGYEPSVLVLACIGIFNILYLIGAMVYYDKKM